jgi:glyoxylase-like metal-dependent hydrolase (beta-lactamase superfamily II)
MPVSRVFGSIEVVALNDGEGPFFQPRRDAFPSASDELWQQADALDPDAVRDGEWLLRFHCFLVRGSRLILVDTGIGGTHSPARRWAPVPGRLPDELAAAGVAPGDVDTVVVTHLHTDHIGWAVTADGGPYFPNARYVLQRAEVDALDLFTPGLDEWLLKPLGDQLSIVDGEEVLADGVGVIPTPGHTPGHQSVVVDSGDERLLITGDLLVHAVQLVDWTVPYALEVDATLARTTRVNLLAALAEGGGAVLATPHLGEPFVVLGG